MDNILIIFIISLLLLLINRKIDKFIFCVLLFVCYIVYFKEYYKEQYTDYSKDESVLKIHDKIKFFEENGMTKTEYEIKNGVQIKFAGDEMIEEKVKTLENTQVKKKSPEIPLKYGQTILLQCYAMEDRYLTGNREGYNKFSPTGENMEGVFTTNEEIQLHEWILYPMDNAKMNTPILFGDKVKIMPKHPTYTRFLVGYQELAPFAYNPYENKCGVFTQTLSKINMNYDYHIWEMVSDFKNSKYSQPIYYNNHILFKLKDRYLSGARQFGFHHSKTNQQVYTVSEKEGKYELYWLIKNKKEPRVKIPNQIKLFENEISLLEPNSSKINLSKYDNNANNYYGSPIEDIDQIDIILDKIHYKQGHSLCKIRDFLLVNFFKERNIKSGYLYTPVDQNNHKIRFNVKTAGKDGIFTDLGTIFESDYLYEWNKDNNIIKLIKSSGKYVSVNILNINSFVEDNGFTNDSDFILKKYKEYFFLLKKIQDKTFVVITNGAGQSLIEYNGLDVPRGGMFKYLPSKKIVTIDNQTLFNDTIKIESKLVPETALIKNELNFLEFPINKNVQFVKVYPIKMGDNCSMELMFHDQSNNQIKFSRDEAIVKKNNDILTGNVSNYDVDQLNTTGENTEIEMDLINEKFVRGGIIENDTNLNNYVYKVKILVAGENKTYTTLETYNLDISQSKTIKFNINKKCRYVKAIILNCMGTCKFKLDLF